jgi:hypothetical protein
MNHLSDSVFAVREHRAWIERRIARERAHLEATFAAAAAHDLCRARKHPESLRNGLRPHCRACRTDVEQVCAVINGEQLPLGETR